MPSELKSDTTRAAGREKSSRYSLRQGFTSRSIILLECENSEEFHQMLANYRATYQPATDAESDLVDQMACARWRICRALGVETALPDTEIPRQPARSARELGAYSALREFQKRRNSAFWQAQSATNPLTPNPEAQISPENKNCQTNPSSAPLRSKDCVSLLTADILHRNALIH
jgi:hypothetical protein